MQLVYLSEVGTLKCNNPIHIENLVIELIIHCNAYLRLFFVSYIYVTKRKNCMIYGFKPY